MYDGQLAKQGREHCPRNYPRLQWGTDQGTAAQLRTDNELPWVLWFTVPGISSLQLPNQLLTAAPKGRSELAKGTTAL